MSDFAEKARSISTPRRWGKPNRKAVIDDRDGTVGGYETEHWDDHQDAHVLAKALRAKLTVEEA